MKYILALLILIGSLIGIFAAGILFVYAGEKINDWEFELDWKYNKYHRFKENVLPGIFLTIIGLIFLGCLVAVYCGILELF